MPQAHFKCTDAACRKLNMPTSIEVLETFANNRTESPCPTGLPNNTLKSQDRGMLIDPFPGLITPTQEILDELLPDILGKCIFKTENILIIFENGDFSGKNLFF